MLPRLRQAVADFSMLLTKGYADKSSLKLVGDRFSLTQRQRVAVMRGSCSDQQLEGRLARVGPRFVRPYLSWFGGRALVVWHVMPSRRGKSAWEERTPSPGGPPPDPRDFTL
jgi:hypothetical protein